MWHSDDNGDNSDDVVSLATRSSPVALSPAPLLRVYIWMSNAVQWRDACRNSCRETILALQNLSAMGRHEVDLWEKRRLLDVNISQCHLRNFISFNLCT